MTAPPAELRETAHRPVALARAHGDADLAALKLADLRACQGRLEEAEVLLTGYKAFGSAPLLRLLVDCFLTLGDHEGARRAYDQLTAQATLAQSNVLLAAADLALGQIRQAADDPQSHHCFVQALIRLTNLEQSLLAGRIRLELARTVHASDPAGAIT